MNSRTISVVIPTYNRGPLLVEAIVSVLAQTVAPLEILVIDDGSTDDTRERLVPYLDRIEYVLQENRGVSAARNRGVESARGELIAFLDADDVWHPRKLERQLASLAESPHLGLLGTGVFDLPSPRLTEVSAIGSGSLAVVSWSQLVVKNYFVTSSIVARRDILVRAGLFDTELQGPEDYDLWLRVAEVAPVANLEVPLTGYRMVQEGLSRQATTMHACMKRILWKVDTRRAWRERRWLRRKAYSYFNYSTAYMFGVSGEQTKALFGVLKSFVWYPWPYRRTEVRMSWARLKLLAVAFLRLLGALPREPLPPTVAAHRSVACRSRIADGVGERA
jgi:glycosyltransferase involved in cell wall biosynthesis